MLGRPETAGCKWWWVWALDLEWAENRAENYFRDEAERKAKRRRS